MGARLFRFPWFFVSQYANQFKVVKCCPCVCVLISFCTPIHYKSTALFRKVPDVRNDGICNSVFNARLSLWKDSPGHTTV